MSQINIGNKPITRRSALKAGVAAGAAAAVTVSSTGNGFDFAYAEPIDTSAPIEKKHTVCDMCNQVPRCGMTCYVQDGHIVRVESRENHPVTPICAKGIASIQELYDPHRILHPLRRTNEKGTGKSEWEQITWDEAYDEIVKQFNRVKEEYGPDAVMFYVGDPKEPRPPIERLSNLFGSSSYGLESSLCAMATAMSSKLVYGKNIGFFGANPTEDTKACIIWSLNAAWSQPNRHLSFVKQKENGCKFVIVDPRITPTVTSLADIHLQPRPGSDGALALGFINVLIQDGLVDMDFIENWTHGFEELKEAAAEWTPERVEEVTWVPADKLVEAAHMLAENTPSTLVSSSAGLTHSSNVGHSQRAVFMIPALLGMIEKKGGYMLPYGGLPFGNNGGTAKWRLEPKYEEENFAERRPDKDDFPVWAHFNQHFQTARLPEYIKEGKIKAAMLCATNAMIWPESKVYQEAIKNLEFSFAMDYYERPWTHDYVDILLPAAMCHERSAPFMVYGRKIYGREPVIEPMGEAREDWQVALELGTRLGFEEECYGGDISKAIDAILASANLDLTNADLLAAKEEGIEIPGEKAELPKYEHGYLRKDGEPGFSTPSGKIEFDSEILKQHGFSGVPVYEEPVHSPYSDNPDDKNYPLVLCTGSRLPYYTHSKLREIPWLNQFMPEPVVRLHPKDARERGIVDGDRVRIFNFLDEVEMIAEVTNIVLPGAVDIFHGWHQANINNLISRDFCPITGFPPFRSSICEVEKL